MLNMSLQIGSTMQIKDPSLCTSKNVLQFEFTKCCFSRYKCSLYVYWQQISNPSLGMQMIFLPNTKASKDELNFILLGLYSKRILAVNLGTEFLFHCYMHLPPCPILLHVHLITGKWCTCTFIYELKHHLNIY